MLRFEEGKEGEMLTFRGSAATKQVWKEGQEPEVLVGLVLGAGVQLSTWRRIGRNEGVKQIPSTSPRAFIRTINKGPLGKCLLLPGD